MKEREREEMMRSFGSVHDERSRGVADGGVTRITHLKKHGWTQFRLELRTANLIVLPNNKHAR